MSVVHTPAVQLRDFAYSESSRIVRFYTRALGVVSVMARGVRRKGSKSGGGLRTFAGGDLTLYVKAGRELQTLKDFAPNTPRLGLGADVVRFAGASVLAELLLRHAGEESNPPLFERFSTALDRVERAPGGAGGAGIILAEWWGLVAALGYHPLLDTCAACGRPLGPAEMGRFDFPAGGVRCGACAADVGGPRIGPGAREQLAGLLAGSVPEPLRLPRAQMQLLSDFVTYHVSGTRPLQSFGFLHDLLPPDDE